MSYRQVYCGWCHKKGHNIRTCPDRKLWIEKNPDSEEARVEKMRKPNTSTRKCSYCKEAGHTRRTCSRLKSDRIMLRERIKNQRERVAQVLLDRGIGVGSLVRMQEGYWDPVFFCGWLEKIVWSQSDRTSNVKVVVRRLRDNKEYHREVDLERDDTAYNALWIESRVPEDCILPTFPASWKSGSDFNEDKYLPKGEKRPWHLDDPDFVVT